MSTPSRWSPLLLLAAVAGCAGGGGSSDGAGGTFFLTEFLESGVNGVPRNRTLRFRFSLPVAPGQDFAERLKIENVQSGAGSNFARAIGTYTVAGEEVVFSPRLPEEPDRSDAGLRGLANYHVFLKAGPDALVSSAEDRIAAPQEFLFDTSEFFEDPVPAQPPRVLDLVARDAVAGTATPLDRLEADPAALARLDSRSLIEGGRILEPGAGGAPGYATPWQFDLRLSEPADPATVTSKSVRMFQVYDDALTGPDSADPGHFGSPVSHPVPILVQAVQGPDAQGVTRFVVRVTPVQTLVDDARYRLVFGGNVMGIDFRKTFIGDNGLTGGEPEPGGQGYVTEFVVYDRPAILGSRTVTYDPLEDGVEPETGGSALSEDLYNTALYNPAIAPGTAVGFLEDFGNGSDGPLAVAPGQILVLDTGDTPNASFGSPFTVLDRNPADEWNPTSAAGGLVTYDSYTWTEYHLESLSVSSGGLLRVRGVNPVLFRVRGVVQVAGTIDLAGRDGVKGTAGTATGGEAGAGGGRGGDGLAGGSWAPSTSACQNFASVLSAAPQFVKDKGAHAKPGDGPGRGQGGGDSWAYVYGEIDPNQGLVGTGGGGGSHIARGDDGDDVRNKGGAEGTPGSACAMTTTTPGAGTGWSRNSSVIGVRGVAGPTYGDLAGKDVLWGGSGGGAGGAQHQHSSFSNGIGSGGSGGGGGGSLTIYSAGSILGAGGTIDVSGGAGGQGAFQNAYTTQPSWLQSSGGGGGGAGGLMVLISADHIDLAGATVDARGGAGGPDSSLGTTVSCNVCNGGGAGGAGLIFLMDRDGAIGGLASPIGTNPAYPNGVLVVSDFQGDRFRGSSAITELFGVGAADPRYLPLSPGDVRGHVNPGQRVRILVSSARASADPLVADPTTEIATFEVALLSSTGGAGSSVDVTGDLAGLNPSGQPDRDAFVRVRADFEYDNLVEGAVGPFAQIDEVTIPISFNG